jgi:hypothetical protein
LAASLNPTKNASPLGVDFDAVMGGELIAQDQAVLPDRLSIPVRPEFTRQRLMIAECE